MKKALARPLALLCMMPLVLAHFQPDDGKYEFERTDVSPSEVVGNGDIESDVLTTNRGEPNELTWTWDDVEHAYVLDSDSTWHVYFEENGSPPPQFLWFYVHNNVTQASGNLNPT